MALLVEIMNPHTNIPPTKLFRGVHALIPIASSLILFQDAHAFLGNFELTDGYVVGANNTAPISGGGTDEAKPNGNTGPELHTYNAGNGTNTFTNIANNTGLWRELYTSRGTSQVNLGNSTDNNQLGAHSGTGFTGDRAYVAVHTHANISPSALTPYGTVGTSLGSQSLVVRSEAQGFGSGLDNPANEGPYNLRFAYTPDALDFGGTNPASLVGNETITMSFVAKINISATDEIAGQAVPAPTPLVLSTFNNLGLRPLEMTFGGEIMGATIVNPAFKIGWTDENNLAYWNGTSWTETSYLFDYASFDEVTITMNLLTDEFDLAVRRQLNSYVSETVATGLSFANNIGTNFGVLGFELFEDPDNSDLTANGVPKTYIDNFEFDVIPEPSTSLMVLLCAVGMAFRRDRRHQ